jgi:hypothetical protein
MKNFLLIAALSFSFMAGWAQNSDPFPEVRLFNKFCAKFALDETPNIPADTNLIAIWKMQEDLDAHNYFVVERYRFYEFVFTYMNRGGSNRTYENVGAFFSKIGNVDFLNVQYYDHDTKASGYFFMKVTDLDSRGWHMTLSLVADPTLKDIPNREALRERIAKNLNNPSFYKKPVHFDKKLPLMYCK